MGWPLWVYPPIVLALLVSRVDRETRRAKRHTQKPTAMTNPSTTNERAISRGIRAARNLRKAEIAQVQSLMASVQGRRYMWGLLSRAGLWTLSTSRDPLEVVYQNGQRQEALYQLDLVTRHAPNEYVRMMAENSTNPDLDTPEEEDPDGGIASDYDPDAVN